MTRYVYDDMNNLTGAVDAQDSTTTYAYDDNYNLEMVIDAKDDTTTYEYWPNNLLKSIKDALNNITQYFYDGIGNLTKIIYPNGNEKYCEYNDDNLIEEISYKDESTSYTFDYDPTHTLKEVTDDQNRVISYGYNAIGWLTDTTDTVNSSLTSGFNTHKAYDRAGRVIGVRTTQDETSTLEYNKRGDLLQMNLPIESTDTSVNFSYDDAGQKTKVSTPDCSERTYSHDVAGRVSAIENFTTAGSSSLTYTYDSNGNILSENNSENEVGSQYTYDTLNRLTSWFDPATETTVTYAYDTVGNLLSVSNDTGTLSSFTYNEANQIANDGFAYDTNGNMTSDETRTYSYDTENRLTQIKRKSDNQTISSHEYDFLGRRIKSTMVEEGTETAEMTFYHYDDSNLLAESNSNGEITARYFYDDNGQLLAMERNGQMYYYQFNAHGDTISMTDGNGNVIARYQYDPWGRVIDEWYAGGIEIENPFRYAGAYGYYHDDATGLYYLKARYYDAGICRFLTKDPDRGNLINPKILNSYPYVVNNPLRNVDPEGLWCQDVHYGTPYPLKEGQLPKSGTIKIAYDIAKAKGLSDTKALEFAETVARADVGIDSGKTKGSVCPGRHKNNCTSRTNPTQKQYGDSEFNYAVKNRDAAALGRALHSYQDLQCHGITPYVSNHFWGWLKNDNPDTNYSDGRIDKTKKDTINYINV